MFSIASLVLGLFLGGDGGGGFPLLVFIMTDKLTNETTIKQIILTTNKTRKVVWNRIEHKVMDKNNKGHEQFQQLVIHVQLKAL